MEVVQGRALLVNTKSPAKITQVIQKSKVVAQAGDVSQVLVHWSLGNSHILKNLGFKKVLSPILQQYDWPGIYKPFNHQRDTASFLTLNRKCFCFNEQGTGKTNSVIWAADYLLKTEVIRRVLIICPLSIMDCAWRSDLFKTAMHRRVGIAHGSREKRIDVIKSKAEFVVINYDGIEVVQDEIARGRFDLIVCDEATALKNPKTRRWKALNGLVKPDTWLWLLTGTPAAQSPEDAYGLAKMVNPSAVPSYGGAWKDKVMYKVTQFKWVPKPEAQALVHQVLQPAIRYSKEECLDLPEMLYSTREVEMTPQQKKYYDTLRREMLIQAAGEEVSAVNAAVQLGKLLQISCIAYNTPVLTDVGWVPIQDVTAAHKVWDGEEWVTQDGAILRGEKEVEECWGVLMTDDHLVLTTDGWIEAGDITDGESSVEFIRAKVRLPDCYSESWDYGWHFNPMCNMAMPMRMRESGCSAQSVLENKTSKASKKLRLPSWKRNSQNEQQTCVLQLPQYVGAMLRSFRQRLSKLWSAGNNRLRTVERIIYEFLGRHGTDTSTWAHIRQDRQRWPVLPRELSLGYPNAAGAQYAGECNYSYTKRYDDSSTSSRRIRHQRCYFEKTPEGGVAYRFGFDATRGQKQKTYDLLNCGPRSRFVVAGSEGPIIVHNCGSVYADTGEVIEFDASSKLNELLNVIQEASHKTLVFCSYQHSISLVQNFLNKHKISCETIHGGVSANKRTDIFNRFQKQADPQVLIIQPQAAAHGVTLTAANTVCWFSPTTSAESYLQANARVHRAGQRNPCLVVHLCSSPVEKKLYQALEDRTLAQGNLLDMFKNFLGGDL